MKRKLLFCLVTLLYTGSQLGMDRQPSKQLSTTHALYIPRSVKIGRCNELKLNVFTARYSNGVEIRMSQQGAADKSVSLDPSHPIKLFYRLPTEDSFTKFKANNNSTMSDYVSSPHSTPTKVDWILHMNNTVAAFRTYERVMKTGNK